MKIHPAAELFPLVEGEDFARLVADIRENGQQVPIVVTVQGELLDGRNRLRACEEIGIEPRADTYIGADPVGYVVSLNVHRRHLNESQRAMVAAKLANMPNGGNRAEQSANLHGASEAAEMLSVSERSVKSAKKVRESGTPAMVDLVEQAKLTVSLAAVIADKPVEQQNEIAQRIDAGEKPVSAVRAVVKEHFAATPIVLPDGLYSVIYADPPWQYEHVKTESRAIENHYPTMTLEEIKNVEVPAAESAILFLWATSPKLAEAIAVIDAWGFTYRTCAVWDKEKMGMGYYFRQQHELLLVASRGKFPAPGEDARDRSVFRQAREWHSKKPAYFAELIERMYPGYEKIELFCRNPREGWAVWGYEAA
jgi:N6-adenosine-specific RNA methylase IME4